MAERMQLPSAEEVWRRYDATESQLTAPVSERMLDLAGIRPGMRVLDLATGRGEPAIRAAHRVGMSGSVVGVDPSACMLEMARARADREGLTNLELHARKAEALDELSRGEFDAILARWALTYFESPVAVLMATRRAMRPGASFVAAVWTEPDQVQYFSFPRRVLEQIAELPATDFESPGPFRYADQKRLEQDLAVAGFVVQRVEELTIPVMRADTAREFVTWCRLFVVGRILMNLPIEIEQAWEAKMLVEANRLLRDGPIMLTGTTRIVLARSRDELHASPTASSIDHSS